MPTAPFLERQIKAGVYRKLDKSKLPNLANMDPEIMTRTALHDPNNEHSIVYLWGTVGLGYNVDMVKKALGTDKIDSWSAILDPKNAAKLAKCGITMLDSPTDVFASVAIYKGLDPNSEKPEDLAVVEETLTKIRPYIKYFHSSSYINDLPPARSAWRSAGAATCSRRGTAARPQRSPGRSRMPSEGRRDQLFRHAGDSGRRAAPENAPRLPEFLMEPAVIAKVSARSALPTATPRLAADHEAMRNDPNVYPGAEVRARLHRISPSRRNSAAN